ncbi:MAG: LegC family aminotransferase [Spirochaetaceae bacterium]|nr:LegC family aminotransferase [Spirochaetaceae bacterium]
MTDFSLVCNFIRNLYPEMEPVLLHCPQFLGNEKTYLNECIDTKFVSYVSHFVTDMEERIKSITGTKHAVALVSGTEALHMALVCSGIHAGEEVLTQALTFAATSSAIVNIGAIPVYIDVETDTLGMSPYSLRTFLEENARLQNGKCINKITGREITACMPMHTFGHPCRIDEIKALCDEYNILLIEDAAESLGSLFKGRHTGTFGSVGIFSFNGNKTITTGGGGMLITDDECIAERVRYLSTTAKQPSKWEFLHTEAGFNLRMPGINAAVGVAQLECLEQILANKRETAQLYQEFFSNMNLSTIMEPAGARSNYWLNAILLGGKEERDAFLEYTNGNGVQTRPIWKLMYKLPPYEKCQKTEMNNSEWLEERVVNLPSSVRMMK